MIQIDMDMPDNCAHCPCGDVQDGWCYVHDEVLEKLENGYPDITKRPDWCPIKESVYPKVGKWLPCAKDGILLTEHEQKAGTKWYGYKCSECNFIFHGNALIKSPFCQNCGAKNV